MADCKQIKKELVAYLYGELQGEKEKRVAEHLESCPACRREMEGYKRVRNEADFLRTEFENAMDSVSWETLPHKITGKAAGVNVRPVENPLGRWAKAVFSSRLRPVWAALLAGIFLGSFLTFFIFRNVGVVSHEADFSVTQDFLDNAELEVARRETLDYLDKSHYLLLDFVQTAPERLPRQWETELTSRQVKELLNRKKYINQQLDKVKMAKAKEICDQLELLFFELARISDYLTPEEIAGIQRLIEQKQLLLKIKLLKKELKGSEV
ncbi:MAG: zf-HC2 domain-containing protein [Candidatus Aminicenantes bacterium]|nr:zf-HC2 domain-containing protein [Candidatus Aminicenantes bacterium]